MWERFSYYGMRALLILYMLGSTQKPGLGFGTAKAAQIYGIYTMAVYLMGVPGGFVADRWLGHYRAVLIGANTQVGRCRCRSCATKSLPSARLARSPLG